MTNASHTTNPTGRERLSWSLVVFAVLLMIMPSVVVVPGPLRSNGSPIVLMSFVLTGLVVLEFINGRGAKGPVVPTGGFLALAFYFVANLASYGVGHERVLAPAIEAATTRALLSLTATVGVTVFLMTHVKTARHRGQILVILLAGEAFSALVGLSEAFHGPNIRYLFQPPGFVLNRDRNPGLRDGFVRVIGTADHPIEFAVLASAFVPIALHYARYAQTRARRRWSTLALVLLLAVIPASVSRSAVISLVAVLLVYSFALTARYLVNGLVAVAAVIGIYALVSQRLFSAFIKLFTNASTDDSITGRTSDYSTVFTSFRHHPFFGIGLGSNPTNGGLLLDNEWLSTLLEGGLVATLALVVVFAVAFKGVVRLARASRSDAQRSEAFAIGAAFAGIFVCNFTFDLLGYPQVTFVLFMLFGLLWASPRVGPDGVVEPAEVDARPGAHSAERVGA